MSIPFQSGNQSSSQRNSATDNSAGILSRLLSSSHHHGVVHDEKSVVRHTVNLLTSTIKADAEQSDLRFCFRIISPSKVFTLQVLIYKNLWTRSMAFIIIVLTKQFAGRKCPGPDGLDGTDKWSNCLFIDTGEGT